MRADGAAIQSVPKKNACVSVDKKGFIQYWSTEDYELPKNIAFKMYSNTDLYEFAKVFSVFSFLFCLCGCQCDVRAQDRSVVLCTDRRAL